MKLQTKKMKQIILTVLTIAIIAKVGYELKFFDVAFGMFKLKCFKKPVQKVSFKTLSFISHSLNDQVFHIEMRSRGWHFIKQYGKGLIYEKDGYEILISKRVFFSQYSFYEVATKEVFELV
ncbi:hypothetical protein KHM83_14405 [Fusibacter paucivorans]|uniref:PH domain-containing protein n=1 Tax=Fusibacter paucivorans TaxID=76009 RepID=A0ABS5PRS8_9FIRM|nr:hypothetical protein [Fusibacter paucivorans]MBS7527873.1 hypothetical protein [Fusibacter paucivorans]